MTGEFDIIQRYFAPLSQHPSIELGIGDDAAILNLPELSSPGNSKLLVATDTLVADVHFPADMPAQYVASRALSVNISDFSAMGVRPQWYTLALTVPSTDEDWLGGFASSLGKLSKDWGLVLVGGDTTRGSLSITLTLMGVATGAILTRGFAKPGDSLWVTGTLGKGGAALKLLQSPAVSSAVSKKQQRYLLEHFYSPSILLDAGVQLAGLASAAIDISDGLLADARHIAERSGVQIIVDWASLPVDAAVKCLATQEELMRWVLSHGDDYQILFTLPSDCDGRLTKLLSQCGVDAQRIGVVREGSGVKLENAPFAIGDAFGYEHF